MSEETLRIRAIRVKEIALLEGETIHQDRDKNTFLIDLSTNVRFPQKRLSASSTLGHTVGCRFLGCRSSNYVHWHERPQDLHPRDPASASPGDLKSQVAAISHVSLLVTVISPHFTTRSKN
jgi:hypothetical protein